MSSDEPRDLGIKYLAATDELLQVMYWLRGERLAEDVAAGDLTRWVGLTAAEIGPLLAAMTASGLVREEVPRADGAPRYALTAAGVREGGRRFADEFADLTRRGHGECGDVECDCHHTGNPADCVHRHESGPTT
jgi:hypothetical protein